MDDEEEIPRRKRDPLRSFRDLRTEREEHYKKILKVEEENRQEGLPSGSKKRRTPKHGV